MVNVTAIEPGQKVTIANEVLVVTSTKFVQTGESGSVEIQFFNVTTDLFTTTRFHEDTDLELV